MIPYHTFPTLPLGLRTFGLMVGIGVLLGAWVAGAYGERWGVERDDTYRLATKLVIAGVVGARLTWVLSHWDQIDSPVDIIAVWNGGLQFSGGFIAAVLVGLPTFRSWKRLTRWRMIDGYAMGLTLGLAFGRIGCMSVGEHFGSTWGASWFPLMVRYTRDPAFGELREPTLGPNGPPIVEGTVFHNTALYELLWLAALFGILWWLLNRKPPVTPSTGIGVFCAVYAPMRFGSDFLRINDNTVLGLTGAQMLMIAVAGAAVWILFFVRPALARLVVDEVDPMQTSSHPDADAAGAANAGDADDVATDDDDDRSDDGAPVVADRASGGDGADEGTAEGTAEA